jgi:hypothetical protein
LEEFFGVVLPEEVVEVVEEVELSDDKTLSTVQIFPGAIKRKDK